MTDGRNLQFSNTLLELAGRAANRISLRRAAFVLLIMLFGAASAKAAAPENAVIINFGVPTEIGAANHEIVPDDIKLSEGGIANFIVSGFHLVTVYRVADNTKLSDVEEQIMPGQDYVLVDKADDTILDTAERSAVNPGVIDSDPNGDRLFIEAGASAAARIVSVHFAEAGTYLVICSVKAHLDDAMIALVTVKNSGKK